MNAIGNAEGVPGKGSSVVPLWAGVLALVYILDLGHVLNKFRHVTVEKLSWPPVNPPQWG